MGAEDGFRDMPVLECCGMFQFKTSFILILESDEGIK